MPRYRLFVMELTAQARRLEGPKPMVCAHDDQAVRLAQAERRDRYAELWRGPELVRIFDRDQRLLQVEDVSDDERDEAAAKNFHVKPEPRSWREPKG